MKTIINSFGCIKSSEIDKFEKHNSVSFPNSYKEFLMTNNGGKPEPNCFDCYDGTDGSVIDWFLGINHKQKYYYDLQYHFDTFKKRIPDNMFPIGNDPFGNLILIGIGEKNFEKIYFWDHEIETNSLLNTSNVFFIADSLNIFLKRLYHNNVG